MKPLFLMFALGGCIWLGTNLYSAASREPVELEISAAEIEAALIQYQRGTKIPVTDEVANWLLDNLVRDKVLVHYARQLDLGSDDPIIKRRMALNVSFLEGDGTGGKLDEQVNLDQTAIEAMQDNDLLVQKRLIQLIEEGLLRELPAKEFTDAEVERYYRAHLEKFSAQQQFTFEHLYFKEASVPVSPDEQVIEGANSARERAEIALQEIAGQGMSHEPDAVGGDASLHGRKINNLNSDRVSLQFGPEFLEGIADIPEGRWSGPVQSAYGAHLVYMHERSSAGVMPLNEVSRKARIQMSKDRRDEYLAQQVSKIRQHYLVTVPDQYAEYMPGISH